MKRQQEQKQSLSGLVTEQVSLSEGISANLGNGYFASSAGDAYWRYKCKDILTYVRTTSRCYESVPVRLQPKDDYRYRKALKLDLNGTVEYFLTPHSHMLTTTGIEVECVHARPSMYLGAYGQWILIRPQGNSITTEPRAIELKGHTLEDDPPNDPDWEPLEAEYGGIYLPEDIRTMEHQRQRQRAEKDISMSLGNAALERHWVGGQGTSYFHQGVGSFPLPGLPDFTGASWLYRQLILWGNLWAAIFGALITLKIFFWCGGVFCRGLEPFHPRATVTSHLLVTLIPSLQVFLQRAFRRYRPVPTAPPADEDPIVRPGRYRRTSSPKPTALSLPPPPPSAATADPGQFKSRLMNEAVNAPSAALIDQNPPAYPGSIGLSTFQRSHRRSSSFHGQPAAVFQPKILVNSSVIDPSRYSTSQPPSPLFTRKKENGFYPNLSLPMDPAFHTENWKYHFNLQPRCAAIDETGQQTPGHTLKKESEGVARVLRELEEITIDLRDRKDNKEVAKDGPEIRLLNDARNLLTDVQEKQKNREDLDLSTLLPKVSTLKRELKAISKNLEDLPLPDPPNTRPNDAPDDANAASSEAPPPPPTPNADPSG